MHRIKVTQLTASREIKEHFKSLYAANKKTNLSQKDIKYFAETGQMNHNRNYWVLTENFD